MEISLLRWILIHTYIIYNIYVYIRVFDKLHHWPKELLIWPDGSNNRLLYWFATLSTTKLKWINRPHPFHDTSCTIAELRLLWCQLVNPLPSLKKLNYNLQRDTKAFYGSTLVLWLMKVEIKWTNKVFAAAYAKGKSATLVIPPI